jgi:hypothetical protein
VVEGTPLLREHTPKKVYPGFESLRLRQSLIRKYMNIKRIVAPAIAETASVTRTVTRTEFLLTTL